VFLYSFEYKRNATNYGRSVGSYRNLDMQLLFNYGGNGSFTLNDQDQQVRDQFLESLVNFVRNQHPVAPGSRIPLWFGFGGANCYLKINERSTMKLNFYQEECSFWIDQGALNGVSIV